MHTDSIPAAHAAYYAALAADAAWHTVLVKVYGAAAGDARYDARGTATPELAALAGAKVRADDARRELALGSGA